RRSEQARLMHASLEALVDSNLHGLAELDNAVREAGLPCVFADTSLVPWTRCPRIGGRTFTTKRLGVECVAHHEVFVDINPGDSRIHDRWDRGRPTLVFNPRSKCRIH